MSNTPATRQDMIDLVAHIKNNCYGTGDFIAATDADMTALYTTIARDFTWYGRAGFARAVVDNLHIYNNSEIYEYMQSIGQHGWPMPFNVYSE